MENKNNKVVVITGAASGIGRETAFRFASQGYVLTLGDLPESGLDELSHSISTRFGVGVLSCPGDLTDETYWEAIVASAIERWGRIDVLVNNAAWRTIETMEEIQLDTWEQTLCVCLTAPAFMARAAAVHMKQQQRGVIVNVSSIMADRAAGYSPAYVACKGGIESLTYELAVLYGPQGIRVVSVCPGNVKTAMSADYRDAAGRDVSGGLEAEFSGMTPLGRTGKPEEIAHAIYWLASDEASFVTGVTLVADGGFSCNLNSYASKKTQFPHKF